MNANSWSATRTWEQTLTRSDNIISVKSIESPSGKQLGPFRIMRARPTTNVQIKEWIITLPTFPPGSPGNTDISASIKLKQKGEQIGSLNFEWKNYYEIETSSSPLQVKPAYSTFVAEYAVKNGTTRTIVMGLDKPVATVTISHNSKNALTMGYDTNTRTLINTPPEGELLSAYGPAIELMRTFSEARGIKDTLSKTVRDHREDAPPAKIRGLGSVRQSQTSSTAQQKCENAKDAGYLSAVWSTIEAAALGAGTGALVGGGPGLIIGAVISIVGGAKAGSDAAETKQKYQECTQQAEKEIAQ